MSSLDDHALLFSSKMSASTELQQEENHQLPPQTQTQTQTQSHPNPSSTLLLHRTIQTPTHPIFAKRKNGHSHSPSPSYELISESGGDRRKAEGRRKKPKTTQNQASPAATTGYIHVRARRGQATDSHSLAERIRREKISQRMKVLQTLVPGCHKVTGKALMLDEIINYVQSLQNQVEFLSMKLASVNPILYDYDFGMDNPEVFIGRPDSESEILLNGNGMVSSQSSQQQAELAYCINNMPPCNTLFQATVGTGGGGGGGGSLILKAANSSTFIPVDINPSPLLWLN